MVMGLNDHLRMRDIDFGVRINRVLLEGLACGDMTRAEFAATFSEYDIMHVRGAGRATMRKIRDLLAASQLTLVKRVKLCDECGQEADVLRDGSFWTHERGSGWCSGGWSRKHERTTAASEDAQRLIVMSRSLRAFQAAGKSLLTLLPAFIQKAPEFDGDVELAGQLGAAMADMESAFADVAGLLGEERSR